MYKDQNMTQLTLPMETSVLISTNDISQHVNDIVETIPENESDEFRHHRDAILYHPKVDALLESLFIQFHSQCLKQNLIDEQAIFNV